MRIGRRAAIAAGIVALTLGAAALAKIFQHPTPPQQATATATQQSTPSAPEHVVYRMLFHQAFVFDERARAAEGLGQFDAGQAYRNALRQEAGLTEQQVGALPSLRAGARRTERHDRRAASTVRVGIG